MTTTATEFIHAPKIGDVYEINGRMEISVFRDGHRHKSLKVEIEHGTFSVTRNSLLRFSRSERGKS